MEELEFKSYASSSSMDVDLIQTSVLECEPVPVQSQVEFTGLKRYKIFDGYQVVFADAWPSWAFTLLSLGCRNVVLVLGCPETHQLLLASGLFQPDCLILFDRVGSACIRLPAVVECCWLQGGLDFVNEAGFH